MTANPRPPRRSSGVPALVVLALPMLFTNPVRGQEPLTIERTFTPTIIAPARLRIAERNRATVSHVFKLGSAFGEREVFDITLAHDGVVRIHADWQGSTDQLAVILNGPGQTGYYARRDAAAPIDIEFNVTDELFRRGAKWRVSVVNFSGEGSSVGRVVITYPALTQPLARLSPSLRRLAEARPAEQPASTGETQRSILPDGRVRIAHPDGTVVIYEAGCGYTTIFPDGTTSSAMCNQVQPASMPVLPEDPVLQNFLEGHRDHLLQQISRLVDNRQNEVDLYLSYESNNADGLFDQIRLRMRLIDNLLQ